MNKIVFYELMHRKNFTSFNNSVNIISYCCVKIDNEQFSVLFQKVYLIIFLFEISNP